MGTRSHLPPVQLRATSIPASAFPDQPPLTEAGPQGKPGLSSAFPALLSPKPQPLPVCKTGTVTPTSQLST